MLNKLLTLALIVALTNGVHLKAQPPNQQPPKPKKTEDTNTNTGTETETNTEESGSGSTEFDVDDVGSYSVTNGMLGGGSPTNTNTGTESETNTA